MKYPRASLHYRFSVLYAALLAAGLSVPALAEVKLPVPAVDQSAVARRGFFYVGGHYVGEPSKEIMEGQIYVEVLAPHQQRRPYPLVLIHGAAQTATNWMGTPDGREGWAEYFVSQGYVVYMIDQPMRGRSAIHAGDGATRMFTAQNEQFQFTAIESDGTWPGREKHTQWPGEGANKGKKGDPVFDQFYASQVETVISNEETQQRNQEAGAALLDKIGPAIVLTHSQSGPFGWLIADARPKLVKGIIAIEPSGPPFENTIIGTGKGRAWGPSDIPITYDPPVKDPSEISVVRDEAPDAPNMSVCWMQKEPARQLVDLKNIPSVIVTLEASYHGLYDNCTEKYLKQAGMKLEWMRLGDKGIHGNGHMVMIEKNNLQIAKVIDDWVVKNVK
ncbi:MAG TPA: alpha/beta hydrolase [Xanthobacteraceae bacterium]|nr:alpha/beta hydrolase [Xanthobacteraceae bacterium]